MTGFSHGANQIGLVVGDADQSLGWRISRAVDIRDHRDAMGVFEPEGSSAKSGRGRSRPIDDDGVGALKRMFSRSHTPCSDLSAGRNRRSSNVDDHAKIDEVLLICATRGEGSS